MKPKDDRIIEVDMEMGTPIFQGTGWHTCISMSQKYCEKDLFFARQQMMAILLGWASPVEF